MKSTNVIKMEEKIIDRVHNLVNEFDMLTDLLDEVEGMVYVDDFEYINHEWFANYYPFHRELDEMLMDVVTWEQKLRQKYSEDRTPTEPIYKDRRLGFESWADSSGHFTEVQLEGGYAVLSADPVLCLSVYRDAEERYMAEDMVFSATWDELESGGYDSEWKFLYKAMKARMEIDFDVK